MVRSMVLYIRGGVGEMEKGDLVDLPNYEALGSEVGKLVAKKQAAYGDSFGKPGQR